MENGLIAILRGIRPEEAVGIGEALIDAGMTCLEVPLNSPEALESIRRLRASLPSTCRVGAGTVLDEDAVAAVAAAGGQLIVSPNVDSRVIRATIDAGLESFPGCSTPSEAFVALQAGAHALKIFPASSVGIEGMQAWRAVLPAGVRLLPVGGVDDSNLADWRRGGADGAGIGGSLYRPGDGPEEVGRKAREIVRAWGS